MASRPEAAAPPLERDNDDFQRLFDLCLDVEDFGDVDELARDDSAQATVRRQQQRLLLLRHAARCPHEDDDCPVTVHCAPTKRLWRHMSDCKDDDCTVANCVSSRYVLSHYRQCQGNACPLCVPVRYAISRNHVRAKAAVKSANTERAAAQASM